MSLKINPPLKFFGGKHYLAKDIHDIASKISYKFRIIPFAGGAQELWNWQCENIGEVLNDINRELTNFYRVLQDKIAFNLFRQKVEVTPYSTDEFELSKDRQPVNDLDIDHAVKYFVNVRQSLCGWGKFHSISKTQLRRGMLQCTSSWLTAIDGLPLVHERLRRVLILNHQATNVIQDYDANNNLQYLDPPYLPETRSVKQIYSHEMSYKNHEDLLNLILSCKSKFIISGYNSQLYNDKLSKWNKFIKDIKNSSAIGNSKQLRQEILWYNF